MFKPRLSVCCWLCLLFFSVSTTVLAQQNTAPIGTVVFSKGDVSALGSDDALRELEQGAQVYEGDSVETFGRSFVVIEFTDQGRAALQPNSRLDLKDYDANRGSESKWFELVKGGLRALSGVIGKNNPTAVRYTAYSNTIGIRGTTFALRVCSNTGKVCEFNRAVSENGRIEFNRPAIGQETIFFASKFSNARREIDREEFESYLDNVAVAIIEGAIWVETPENRFELEAGLAKQQQPPPQNPSPGGPPPDPNQSGIPQPDPSNSNKPPHRRGDNGVPKQPKLPKPPKS